MKIKGRTYTEPNVEIVVIPRPDGPIVFKAVAVLDHEPFTKLCPEPIPPKIMRQGGAVSVNIEDPKYKGQMIAYASMRLDWLVLESLKATPDLEWETVKPEDPATWANYKQELKDSKFTTSEINYIISAVLNANSLSESKMNEARQAFLAIAEAESGK